MENLIVTITEKHLKDSSYIPTTEDGLCPLDKALWEMGKQWKAGFKQVGPRINGVVSQDEGYNIPSTWNWNAAETAISKADNGELVSITLELTPIKDK